MPDKVHERVHQRLKQCLPVLIVDVVDSGAAGIVREICNNDVLDWHFAYPGRKGLTSRNRFFPGCNLRTFCRKQGRDGGSHVIVRLGDHYTFVFKAHQYGPQSVDSDSVFLK